MTVRGHPVDLGWGEDTEMEGALGSFVPLLPQQSCVTSCCSTAWEGSGALL